MSALTLAPNVVGAVDMAAADEYAKYADRIVGRMSEFDAYGDVLNDADMRTRNEFSALDWALLAGACRSGRVSFIQAA
jgi:hypothetical protein